jgi:O-antigen/teichoic acid export membrane protein
MKGKITNKQIFASLFWKVMERGGVQGVGFIVSIVLARILTPEEFGLIALVTIFLTLANVFVQSGFNTALIQKKNADSLDFSTVFYFSAAIAGILYAIILIFSPLIAGFYDEPLLGPVLKVLSIILFFGAVNSVQIAVISRNMEFKKLFYSSLGSVIFSGFVGIAMAYNGFGVWALVGQQISNQLLTTLIMWFTIKWRPKLQFSIERFKSLFSYGNKILVASLIDTFYLNLRGLTIGKLFNAEMVGYYNRGKQFPTVIVSNIDGSIQSVMLPTYSAHQDNRKRVKDMVRRSIVTSSFLIFPLMAGLFIISEPLVKVVLTDKWLPSVPFLQIYCLVYAIRPLQTANIQALKGLGFSGTFLRLEIVNKGLGVLILIISVPFGVLAIAWGVLISSLISMALFAYPNIKLLGYTLKEQIIDVGPAFLISLIMTIGISSIYLLNFEPITLMMVQIILGILVYFSLARVFKLEAFNYLIRMLKSFKMKDGANN